MIAALLLAAAVPAAVLTAADRQRQDASGVVAYLADGEADFTTPLGTRRTRTRTWVVAVDGDPRRAVVTAITIDGRAGSEAERAQAQAEAEAGYANPQRQLFAPYDRRHLADYQFNEALTLRGLAPGERAYSFESAIPDERHGRGTFILTPARCVRWLAFIPNRLPPGAREGHLTLTRTPVAPGWWSLLQLNANFTGGIGPLPGSVSVAQRSSGHRRFASVAAALAATPKN